MTWLLISQTALWIVLLALSVVTLALARQVGVLHARIAPAGALKPRDVLSAGQQAPAQSVPTLNAGPVRIGDRLPDGATQLLLFVSPECAVCKQVIPAVGALAGREGRSVLLVSDGREGDLLRMIERFSLQRLPFANNAEIGQRFGVGKLPHAVLIDAKASIIASDVVESIAALESLIATRHVEGSLPGSHSHSVEPVKQSVRNRA